MSSPLLQLVSTAGKMTVALSISLALSSCCLSAMSNQDQQPQTSTQQSSIVPFTLEAQNQTLDMNEVDCITQSSFQELFDKQTKKGLPFLLCNVSTASSYKNTYAHRMSVGILNYIYGDDFPNPRTENKPPIKNPINQCPIEDPIDILYVHHNPAASEYQVTKLGTDLHILRGKTRLKNIVNLANKNIHDAPESQEFKTIGMDIAAAQPSSLGAHGHMLLSQHYLAKARASQQSEKTYNKLMNACKHLWHVARTQENYYLSNHAKYALATIAQHPAFKKLVPSFMFVPNNHQLVRDLVEQHHDILSQERALIMHAEQLENTDTTQALKIYEHLLESIQTPTKKAYATVKHAHLNTELPVATRIEQTKTAIAASQKYLESPVLHRQQTARKTVDLGHSLLANLEDEQQAEQAAKPVTEKKVARKLF